LGQTAIGCSLLAPWRQLGCLRTVAGILRYGTTRRVTGQAMPPLQLLRLHRRRHPDRVRTVPGVPEVVLTCENRVSWQGNRRVLSVPGVPVLSNSLPLGPLVIGL
jgi:hypothetical protein